MRFGGTLISVKDIEKAKNFYGQVMEQKVLMDLGTHVTFENGLSLQSDYQELVGGTFTIQYQPNCFQLYFEVEDLDVWEGRISQVPGIQFLHRQKEYPWGQQAMRFYDFDGHIVEVSESMESVAKRYLSNGLSPEKVAELTMYPVEFVRGLL